MVLLCGCDSDVGGGGGDVVCGAGEVGLIWKLGGKRALMPRV